MIKTFAASKVDLIHNGEKGQCYTASDAVGNFELANNGVSANCSKRTPTDFWDEKYHLPSGAADFPQSDQVDDDTAVDPSDCDQQCENEAVIQCLKDNVSNMSTRLGWWYEFGSSIVTCYNSRNEAT